jgi:hypothetical protein
MSCRQPLPPNPESDLPPIPPVRRLLVSLLAIGCLLLGASTAAAQGRRHAACPAARRTHATHACAKRSHAKPQHRSHRGAKAHAKARHQAGHGNGVPGSGSKQTEATTPAVCEDGSAPSTAGACDDGSEPACENGAEPSGGKDGKLVCGSTQETGATFSAKCESDSEGGCSRPTPPVCQDGSAPVWSKQGYYDCRYGEPTCETGTEPVFSSSGSILYCEPGEDGEDS